MTKEEIRKSVEARYYAGEAKSCMLIHAIICVLCSFLFLAWNNGYQAVLAIYFTLTGVMFLICGSYSLFYFLRFRALVKEAPDFEEMEAVLCVGTDLGIRWGCSMKVEINDKDETKEIETHFIFFPAGIQPKYVPRIHDYAGKSAKIAYDRKTGRVAVIGL